MTGRVDSVGDVENRAGTTEKGKGYSFWQQKASLALGGLMVEVVYQSDDEPKSPLCVLELDQIVKIKVEKPRVFNGRVSFDAVI